MDITTIRRATAAAQQILRETDPGLVVDGKAGSYTAAVYARSNADVRRAADAIATALGAHGGMGELLTAYKSQKGAAGGASGDFDLRVIPAIVRESRQRGINPLFPVAQLALESAWGKSTPLGDDGKPSYNYGGIKRATVRTARSATAKTWEVEGGRRVERFEQFAAFDTPADFAKAYMNYKFTTSKRYPGLATASTMEEYASILQKGGYATDPAYATKLVAVGRRAAQVYALDVA